MDANNSLQKISNWDKPGGTLGLIVATVAGIGGCMLLYKALPFLIAMTTNLITLGVELLVLGGLIYLVCDKKFRKNFSMIYFIVMRKIAGIIIETNPIAILERKVLEMKKKIQEIVEQLGNVKGLIQENRKRVKLKKEQLQNELLKLQQYKEMGKEENAKVCERQVDRLTNAVKKQEARLKDSENWYKVLTELKEHADLVVLDTENEVNDKKEEFESIRAQHKAFSSIMSIIKGDPDEMQDFMYAMDYIEHDINMRLGAMSTIMDGTTSLLDDFTVEDGVTSAKAAEILRKYEEGGLDAIFSTEEPSNTQDVKRLTERSSKYSLEFNTETQDPVLVERGQPDEKEEQQKYFS